VYPVAAAAPPACRNRPRTKQSNGRIARGPFQTQPATRKNETIRRAPKRPGCEAILDTRMAPG